MIFVLMACTAPQDSATPPDTDDSQPSTACVPDLTLSLADNPASPLAPLAMLDEDVAFRVQFRSPDVSARSIRSGTGVQPVVGLRAESTYTLQALAGDRCSQTLEWTTGALPGEIPNVSVAVDGPDDGLITLVGPAELTDNAVTPWMVGLDRQGHVVYVVDTGFNGLARDLYEMPDRTLWAGSGNEIQHLDATGATVTTIQPSAVAHHDTLPTENGILVLYEEEELHDLDGYGEDVPVLGDRVVELGLDGQELWSWRAFDHLDVETFDAELVQPRWARFGYIEWSHINGMSWADDGTLVLSSRNRVEVLGVDRDSGEIVWTVDADSMAPGERMFRGQHAPIRDGDRLTVFDNLSGSTSRAVTYRETDAGWVEDWSWDVGALHETFGSVEPLANGDMLVTSVGQRDELTPGTLTQVTPDGEVVWQLSGFGDSWVFRGRPAEEWVTVD